MSARQRGSRDLRSLHQDFCQAQPLPHGAREKAVPTLLVSGLSQADTLDCLGDAFLAPRRSGTSISRRGVACRLSAAVRLS